LQSQIWGRCVAAANNPLPLVTRGVQQWLGLGLPASKLVLGLPWQRVGEAGIIRVL
jgi:di-N-acetylchitobiase